MTAVQWLMSQILEGSINTENGEMYIKLPKDALNEAKEMERQQIIEAHGVKQKTKSNPGSIVTYGYNYTGEMYYNDKFLTPKK
jgi:hypothetical protein